MDTFRPQSAFKLSTLQNSVLALVLELWFFHLYLPGCMGAAKLNA